MVFLKRVSGIVMTLQTPNLMSKIMNISPLFSISPLDGRYHNKVNTLREIVSEYGLIRYRYQIEIEWLITLIKAQVVPVDSTNTIIEKLNLLNKHFNQDTAHTIKEIEKTTNHDVKAVEYALQQQLSEDSQLKPLLPFIHFACTSEDINNLAYGLMLKDCKNLLLDNLIPILQFLKTKAHQYANLSMLSRTHGQAASPTTLGKEWANVLARLQRQHQQIQQISILGKCNGAVGNYNAHMVSHPNIHWPTVVKQFIETLGLEFNPYTTQIEPHDSLAECLHCLSRINTILIDFCRDNWHYISLSYFTLKKVDSEVGSSTMPHKINPIDFENAEGNFGIANALASHLANKLPISRLQRDLTDSTVLRNLGSVFGYSVLGCHSLLKGLNKLQANEHIIATDLNQHWEVLAEPIQTVLRAHGVTDAYEQLKVLTRGAQISEEKITDFIQSLNLPKSAQSTLMALTPQNYIGLAASLAREV